MDDLKSLMLAVMRSAVRHRTTGHAAEMSFFSMLALVPATVAIGGAMHVVAQIAGAQSEVKEQAAAVSSIRLILGTGIGEEVIVPFVRAQLSQPRGGLAVGSLLVTWWLFSHLFHSTSHALDTVYEVRDHRRTPVRRAIALSYALCAAVAITVTLAVMSAVPLGITDKPYDSVAVSAAELVWTVARWPLLAAVVVLALTSLYRFSPDVQHTFRQCLPGAILGVALWIALIVGFRYYLALGFGAPTGVLSLDPSIILIGKAVGAVVATAFLFYFASNAVLLGAELNAELLRRAGARVIAAAAAAEVPPTAVPAAASVAAAPVAAAPVAAAPVAAAPVAAQPGADRSARAAGLGLSALARLRSWRPLGERQVDGALGNGKGTVVPTPSPGRRVRVVATGPPRPDVGSAAADQTETRQISV